MDLVKLTFKVNRMREGWDEGPQIVECTIYREREYAKQISSDDESYAEPKYDRFCREVPDIVRHVYGLDCSPDWYFDTDIKIMEEN